MSMEYHVKAGCLAMLGSGMNNLPPAAQYLIAAGTGLASIWLIALGLNRLCKRAHNNTGNPAAGIIIFAEPVNWLYIIWGFCGFCRGMRKAGKSHHIHLYRWCSTLGALFVFPDLMWHRRQLHKAERLARRIDRMAERCRPIHLVGYSSGTFLVLEACKRVKRADVIGQVVLMGSSISPEYPLHEIVTRARSVHNFHSVLDVIAGVGPMVFGANDRRWLPGAGAVGFENPPEGVIQHRWRPRYMLQRYFGGHFSVASSAFVAKHIAPLLDTPLEHYAPESFSQ